MAKSCRDNSCYGMYVEPFGRCNVCNEEDPKMRKEKPRFFKTKRVRNEEQLLRHKFYQSKAWKDIRNAYISRNPLCEICERFNQTTPAKNVHHKVPVSKGGTNDFSNLMSVCIPCHHKVEGKDV